MVGVAGAITLGIASCLSAARQVSLTSGFRFSILRQEWLFHSNMTNSVNGGLLQYFLLHKMQPYHNAIYC